MKRTVLPRGKINFSRDIKPILSNYCYACHGPDSAKRKAGLRLDRKEDAFRELASGEIAVVPGEPSKSALLERVTSAGRQFPDAAEATGKAPVEDPDRDVAAMDC